MKLSLFILPLIFAFCGGCAGQKNLLSDHRIQERLDAQDRMDSSGNYYDSYWFLALETGDATVGVEAEYFNPFMMVYDDTGKKIGEDDDGGYNDDAKMTFRVTFGHRYRIIASSKEPGETGDYRIKSSNNLTFDSVINRD